MKIRDGGPVGGYSVCMVFWSLTVLVCSGTESGDDDVCTEGKKPIMRRCRRWWRDTAKPLPDGIAQLTNRALRLATAERPDVNNNSVQRQGRPRARDPYRRALETRRFQYSDASESCVRVRAQVRKCVVENTVSSHPAPAQRWRRGCAPACAKPWPQRVRACASISPVLLLLLFRFRRRPRCCCCCFALSFVNNDHVGHRLSSSPHSSFLTNHYCRRC